MAGFLDPNQDVVDMVLTQEGRRLLSLGKLRFVYWIPHDDGVHYNHYVANSASLSQADYSASLQNQLEYTPVVEALPGYKSDHGRQGNAAGIDNVSVGSRLFTVPLGTTVMPLMVNAHRTSSLDIGVKSQKMVDFFKSRDQFGNQNPAPPSAERGYRRFDASKVDLQYSYTPTSFPADHRYEGFLVRIYLSGSDGLTEVRSRRDESDALCYRNDLMVDETGSG